MGSTTEILRSLNLLSWAVLAVGWERGWVTKTSLADYATERLQLDTSDDDLAALSSLAFARQYDDVEITQLVRRLAGARLQSEAERSLESWRLARLTELQQKELLWDEKVTQLEELAAEFGNPADMRFCSRYGASPIDPLDAMDELLAELRRRLCVN